MSELKNKLLTLGFEPEDGKDCVYIKKADEELTSLCNSLNKS